jgi:hypothetical protein
MIQVFTLIELTSPIQKLASGFDWSEARFWVQTGGYLLFSDAEQHRLPLEGGEGVVFISSPAATPAPRPAAANRVPTA